MATMAVKDRRDMARPQKEPSPKTYEGRLASRLKALREMAGLDAEAAAKAITSAGYRVTDASIYRWERGDTQPHVSGLPSIAKAYGCSARTVLPNE